MKTEIDIDSVGKRAATLSIIEIGLGSVVHALNIPLGGHVLSLNQGFILTRASIELKDSKSVGLISMTAALLKSLSPAGQKLTPMLAISAQGQLFSVGTLLFGNKLIGQSVGMTLLSLWGFIQPLAIYLLIFGKELVSMANFYLKEVNQLLPVNLDQVIRIMAVLVLTKIILGIALVFAAHRVNPIALDRYEAWARTKPKLKTTRSPKNHFVGALSDLTDPLFLISMSLMVFFFVFSQSDHSKLIWLILRPIAIAYVLFLAIRLFPVERLVKVLRKKDIKLADSLEIAIRHLKSF